VPQGPGALVKATLPTVSSPLGAWSRPPAQIVCDGGAVDAGSGRVAGVLSAQHARGNEPRHGDEWTTYRTLGQTRETDHGMTDGPRGLR